MEREQLDFNAEAHALFARLNLAPGTGGARWNDLDAIYTHPASAATIYVGNQVAASSLPLLKARGITSVVNCTAGLGALPCYFPAQLAYHVFDVASWQAHTRNGTDEGVAAFTGGLFSFIDAALARGESVLVHCLAGAHRAGTTGVLCLMRYGRVLDVAQAIAAAKQLRRVIDPIGRLPELLNRFLRVELAAAAAAAAAAAPAAGAGGGAGAVAAAPAAAAAAALSSAAK